MKAIMPRKNIIGGHLKPITPSPHAILYVNLKCNYMQHTSARKMKSKTICSNMYAN